MSEPERAFKEAAKDAIRALPALVVTNSEYVPQLKRRPDQGIDRAAALLAIEHLALPASEDDERRWARSECPPAPATPAELGLREALLGVSIAGHRRIEKYVEQEAAAAARKDWSMADRWRYLASGNAEAIAALDATLAAERESPE